MWRGLEGEHEPNFQLTRSKNRHWRRSGSSKKRTRHRQTKNQADKCTLSYERENLASKEKLHGCGITELGCTQERNHDTKICKAKVSIWLTGKTAERKPPCAQMKPKESSDLKWTQHMMQKPVFHWNPMRVLQPWRSPPSLPLLIGTKIGTLLI
jgi:hypothetical protein